MLYDLDARYYPGFEERCAKYGISNVKFIKTVAEKIPFPNEYFDVIISISTLEHNKLDVVNRSVKEIARVLKNGKRLVATVAIIFEDYPHPRERPNFPFWSEDDIVQAFTNGTGMRLIDDTSLTGWKSDSKEIINKYKDLKTLTTNCTGWLPIGVITEKR